MLVRSVRVLQDDEMSLWKLLECRITRKSQRHKETLIIHIPVSACMAFCIYSHLI